MIAEHDGLLE